MELRCRLGMVGVLLLVAACKASSQAEFAPNPPAALPLSLTCRMIEAAHCAYGVNSSKPLDRAFCGNLGTADEVQGFVADDANWWRSWLPGVAPDYRDAVYLARYGQDVLIVFRGTKPLNIEDVASVEDWVNDANAELKPEGPLGPVHRGFHQSLDNLWAGKHGLGSALAAWSRDGKLQDRNVYVVGHSKGGAVADLAALKLYANHLPVKAVFTFAGARAGGDEFYANYQGAQIATTRFENQRDLVPHLPPAQEELQLLSNAKLLKNAIRIKGAYRPVGSLHYIHADGQVETPATPSEEEALGKRRLKEFEKWASERPPEQVFGKLASAHSIDPPDKNETGTELHRYYRAACR